jgi:hypothetical protein
MVSRVLSREGASPRVSGKFYQAVVQSVLLYGSETWNMGSSMLAMLKGFHHRIARRLSGRMPRYLQEEDRWEYPPIAEALEIVGLQPIEESLCRRRNAVAGYVACRPIFALCNSAGRLSGSSNLPRWTEQLDIG